MKRSEDRSAQTTDLQLLLGLPWRGWSVALWIVPVLIGIVIGLRGRKVRPVSKRASRPGYPPRRSHISTTPQAEPVPQYCGGIPAELR